MIKIMLVDDEPPFIEELGRIITEYSDECIILGEYYSGKSALLATPQLKPDIIFTDIKMPWMDGVEFSKAIRDNFPEIITVVISSYSSFDYVRETFRADVFDYLLKPIEPEMVKSVMDKIIYKVKNNKHKQDFEIYHSIIFSKKELGNLDSIHDKYNNYVIFVLYSPLSMFRNSGLSPSYPEMDQEDLIGILKNLIDSSDDFWIYDLGNNEIAILSGFEDFRESKIKKFLKCIMEYFENISVPLTLGVSNCVSNINELRTEYLELKKVLLQRVVIGKSQIIKSNYTFQMSKYSGLTTIEEGKLLKYINDRNLKGLEEVLIQMFIQWEQQSLPSNNLIKILNEIMLLVERSLSMSSADVVVVLDNKLHEIVATSRSFGELLEVFWSTVRSLFMGNLDEIRMMNNQEQFVAIVEYLRMNFAKPVTLMNLCEVFGVSQTYLCNIFKIKSGKTFVEYMTQLRMEKAKELMASDMLLKDIAEIVGFTDQHYFSRVFKSYQGITPTEYLKEICRDR